MSITTFHIPMPRIGSPNNPHIVEVKVKTSVRKLKHTILHTLHILQDAPRTLNIITDRQLRPIVVMYATTPARELHTFVERCMVKNGTYTGSSSNLLSLYLQDGKIMPGKEESLVVQAFLLLRLKLDD